MALKLGSTAINNLYLGSTAINKAYLGTGILFSSAAWSIDGNTILAAPNPAPFAVSGNTITEAA